jgi:pyruvate-ferredoxin/flavodoxin oxidoreductase
MRMTLPLTVADWAATEPRFGRHFAKVPRARWDDRMTPFHEYLALGTEERRERTPFIWVLDAGKRLARMAVSDEMVRLAEDRIALWDQIKEMAGISVSAGVRARVAAPVEEEYARRLEALRAEYEEKIAELKRSYPALITRRIAEALVGGDAGTAAPAAPRRAAAAPPPFPVPVKRAEAPIPAVEPAAPAAVAVAEPGVADEAVDPWIDTELCTSCNDCLNLNPRLFAYNGDKKAVLKDPKAGTFADLVKAAEKCPAQIIHPGPPRNPKEPGLDKWIERAKKFQ